MSGSYYDRLIKSAMTILNARARIGKRLRHGLIVTSGAIDRCLGRGLWDGDLYFAASTDQIERATCVQRTADVIGGRVYFVLDKKTSLRSRKDS